MSDERNDQCENIRPYSQLDIEAVEPILNDISIFAGLSDIQLNKLFGLLRKTSYKVGERVFVEGERPDHIYIVQSGAIKLIVNADDTPLELILFEKGHCFGETSVIGIQPHAATALCVEDTDLIVLSRNTLLSLYKTDLEIFSTLILNIAREACRRLHKTDEILLHYVMRK